MSVLLDILHCTLTKYVPLNTLVNLIIYRLNEGQQFVARSEFVWKQIGYTMVCLEMNSPGQKYIWYFSLLKLKTHLSVQVKHSHILQVGD